jgi:uncharacterized protein (DUF1330 family)
LEQNMADETAQGQEQQAEKAPERPAWLQEKYKTVEDQAKAYNELASLRAREQAERSKGPLAIPEAPSPFTDDNFTVEAALQGVGMTQDQIVAEMAENNGQLKPETYQKFKDKYKAGKGVVDTVVATQIRQAQQQAQQAVAQATQVAGGEQQLDTLLKFAASLSPTEKQELNARLGNPATAVGAVLEIKGRYDLAVKEGKTPDMLEGGAPAAGGAVKAFASAAEVRAAMKDPRYQRDTAYRKAVQDRLEATPSDVCTKIL